MKEMKFEDEMLDCTSQTKMRDLVAGLPEDTLSLAWRSSLNEKLIEAGKTSKRKSRMAWYLRPAFGLAMAGALAAIVFVRTNDIQTPGHTAPALEAALISNHRESVQLTDMVGVGLNPLESQPTSTLIDDPNAWTDVDIDSL